MPRCIIILLIFSSLAIAVEQINFDEHVFPIFQQSCLNCHNPDKTKGGLDLSSYLSALKGGSGGKIVDPGETNSSLITSVQQTSGKKMPPEGDKLSDDQIRTLTRWIVDGLLENKSSSARKPTKPKFESTLRSDPAAKPDGPPPMPKHLLLEPSVVTSRPSSIHAIAASPWAPLLAVTGQRQVLLHHTESLELVGILPFPEGEPTALAFTPDSRYLLVGGGVPGKSGTTVTFDITTGTRLLTAAREFDSVLAADIRPSFDFVATGGPSRLLKIWNTETGELVKSVKKHTDWITTLDLSADGVLLASGDRNGGVWVWESQTASEFHTLRGHQAAISTAVFRSDSNVLATASEDGTVRFWEMTGGNEVKKIDAHPGGVTAFAFSQNGMSVTAGRDFKLKLWSQDFTHIRDLAQNLPAIPTAVALDSEGKHAFIADAEGAVRVFQTTDSKPVGEIQANPPTIAARLEILSSQSAHQNQAIAAAEKASEPANQQIEIAKATLGQINAAHKHWAAAAINAKAISTRHQAEVSALAIDDQQNQFSKSAANVTIESNALNLFRNKHASLVKLLNRSDLGSPLREEIEATLVAIDIRMHHELVEFSKVENETLDSRDRIERDAPLAHQKHIEAMDLYQSYLQARD
ncbi:MAG: c-type cytochrome domain-containing protein [Luteolibacter sp.]